MLWHSKKSVLSYKMDGSGSTPTHTNYISLWNCSYYIYRSICCDLRKGYWIRNNQNGGWKWNGNLYNINKIQYSPAAWKR